MKIDLGNKQSIAIGPSSRNIILRVDGRDGGGATLYLSLTETVAVHAALGEQIRILRKKLS